MNELVEKPWGSYTNLMDEPYTKVKKIVIKPGQSPSYQYHFKRSEIWVVVQGIGKYYQSFLTTYLVYILKEQKHQFTNVGNSDLIFVEIQLGDYFGEDDIVRLEDKYGRV